LWEHSTSSVKKVKGEVKLFFADGIGLHQKWQQAGVLLEKWQRPRIVWLSELPDSSNSTLARLSGRNDTDIFVVQWRIVA